jgi:Tat protein secretion system quality control protein TatD with DNase activity
MTGHRGYPDQIRRIVQEIGKQKNMTEKEVNSLVENNFASLISDVPEVRRKWKALRSE